MNSFLMEVKKRRGQSAGSWIDFVTVAINTPLEA